MTREEAIEMLKKDKKQRGDCFISDALDIAIEALSAEPCDCISREEVLRINNSHHGEMPNHINHQIWEEIKALPSIQPKSKTDVLDKIRAEIKEESRFCPLTEGLERAIEIIDKYKAERNKNE